MHLIDGRLKTVHLGVNPGGKAGHTGANDQNFWFWGHVIYPLKILHQRQ
jgi:hypothetical protein